MNTGSKYEIDTGSATAGVRGTEFLVELDQDKNSKVIVYEGTVYVYSKEMKMETAIEKNEKIEVNRYGEFKQKEKHNELPPQRKEQLSNVESEQENIEKIDSEWLEENLSKEESDDEKNENESPDDIKVLLENQAEDISEQQSSTVLEEINDDVSDRAKLIINVK